MVRVLIFLLLSLHPLISFAGQRLSLQVAQLKQQLGLAFDVQLTASGINNNLSHIDLSPLEDDFGVIVKEYSGVSKDTEGGSRQQLSLQLYPRRLGRIQVPKLFIAATSSNSLVVEALPAQTAAGPIRLNYQLSNAQPWQRQQVLLNVTIDTPDRFARLETTNLEQGRYEFRPIPAYKETQGQSTRLGTGWTIFPEQAGQQLLSLPPVLYHLQGTIERRFYLPRLELKVKALPGYIPPLMPVGRVYIESSIDSNLLVKTAGDTYNWAIRLHSPELLSHFLPPVLRQINSTADINYLTIQSQRTDINDHNGNAAEVIHTVPFQILSTGKVKLPVIRIQYFDPRLGRVSATEYSPPQLWAMAIYWQLIIGTIFIILSTLLARIIIKHVLNWRMKHRHMQQAIEQIRVATSGLQLREALRQVAIAEHWPGNLSIGEWARYWDRHYAPSSLPVMSELSKACYSISGRDNKQLRDDLLTLLSKRKAINHHLYAFFG